MHMRAIVTMTNHIFLGISPPKLSSNPVPLGKAELRGMKRNFIQVAIRTWEKAHGKCGEQGACYHVCIHVYPILSQRGLEVNSV